MSSVACEGSLSLQLISGQRKTVSMGMGSMEEDLFTDPFFGVKAAAEIPRMEGFEMSDLK